MTGYADAPVIASHLRELTRDFDVSILVFLRRQDDFMESLYTQTIHEGSSQTFDEFRKTIKPEAMNWQKLLEAYAAEFGHGNITARVYHKDCYPQPQDLIVDFCRMVGVRPECLKQRVHTVRNQGFSMEAVEMARLCNPCLTPARRRQLRQMLQVVSAKPVFQSYSYLDLDARRQLLSLHAKSNTQVRRDYLGGQDDQPLFPEPDELPTSFQTAEAEALTVKMMKMLLELKEAENRSGILRFMMRVERGWHQFRQKWLTSGRKRATNTARRQSDVEVPAPVIPTTSRRNVQTFETKPALETL